MSWSESSPSLAYPPSTNLTYPNLVQMGSTYTEQMFLSNLTHTQCAGGSLRLGELSDCHRYIFHPKYISTIPLLLHRCTIKKFENLSRMSFIQNIFQLFFSYFLRQYATKKFENLSRMSFIQNIFQLFLLFIMLVYHLEI